MNGQLPLAVGLRPRPLLETFVAGPNGPVLDALMSMLDDGRPPFVFLSGAAGSGRSHLLLGAVHAAERRGKRTAYLPLQTAASLGPEIAAGAEHADLVAIDDVHVATGLPAWEQGLFRLFNAVQANRAQLLISADRGPLQLDCKLPDLKSRLASGASFRLQPLGDDDRLRLLLAQADERGFRLADDAARWMLQRCRRDPLELTRLLDRLDSASLSAQRPLTLAFVREQLRGGDAD